MKRFEYCFVYDIGRAMEYTYGTATLKFSNGQVIHLKEEKFVDVLDNLGKDGWEMVGGVSINEGMSHTIYFKREMR